MSTDGMRDGRGQHTFTDVDHEGVRGRRDVYPLSLRVLHLQAAMIRRLKQLGGSRLGWPTETKPNMYTHKRQKTAVEVWADTLI